MRNRKSYPVVAALVVFAATFAVARASAPASGRNRALSHASNQQTPGPQMPGPEMVKLKFMVGEWDVVSTYPKSVLFPDGGEEHGTYSARLGPGGFSIVADFRADGVEGSVEGHEITTWDPQENSYMNYTFGNQFPGAYQQRGHWEDDNFIQEGEFNMAGTKFNLRQSVHSDGPNGITLQEWFSQEGAPMQLMQTTKATRK